MSETRARDTADVSVALASKRANLTPYSTTSSNRTLANADMQKIWGLVGALTITLPASGVIDTNSTVTLWAVDNTVTISVPSGIAVVGTPSGTVSGSGTFTISSGTVANLFLYNSTTWLYSAGGGTVAANFTNAATGTYTDGSGAEWKYIDYTASSTLTINRAGLVECLIVAGGGGGGGSTGSAWGGGGGAGGLLGFGTFTNATSGALYLPAATYTVTVGSGGIGGTTGNTGSFGNDSRLGGLRAHRGAPGTPGSSNNLIKGGSGGGGASGGSGIPGQGYSGAGLGGGQAGGGGGAGGAASGATAGAGISIDMRGGSSYTYSTGGAATTTFTTRAIGDGGDGYSASTPFTGQTGGNGRVVVRVRIN